MASGSKDHDARVLAPPGQEGWNDQNNGKALPSGSKIYLIYLPTLLPGVAYFDGPQHGGLMRRDGTGN